MKIKQSIWRLIAAAPLCAGFAVAANAPTHYVVNAGEYPISIWSRNTTHPRYAILLIHGRTWSALPDFDLQVPQHNRSIMQKLVKLGYAAYAIDLRGYGATPRNTDGWTTPNESADDVATVLQWIAQRHRDLPKPILFGWSNGAVVALLTAQRHPELLSDLILNGFPRDPATMRSNPPPPPQPPREINTRERAISDFISPQVTPPKLIEAYVAAALKADPVRADWRALDEFNAIDLAKVKSPTLVIEGERDPLAPIAPQSHLFVGLANPDKQWIILAGGDHAALLEDTQDAFIAAVHAFVSRPRLRP